MSLLKSFSQRAITSIVFLMVFCFINSQNLLSIKQTPWASNGNGNIFYLTLHNVECDSNQVLSYWKLETSGSLMSIRYYCIYGLSVLDEMTSHNTEWNDTNGNKQESLGFLDRHYPKCREDAALNSFQLVNSGDKVRFIYKCNKVKYNWASIAYTSYFRSGTGEVQGLSVVEVKCPNIYENLQAIQGFKMNVKYSTRWCTFLCSDFQDIQFQINYVSLGNLPSEI